MLTFGKYRGKTIDQIKNHGYIKYLSNYDYGLYCTKNIEHDKCDDTCQFRLGIYDRHLQYLNHIFLNKEAYISYWNDIDTNKNRIWNELEQINDKIEQIRLIYNNRDYFNYETIKWLTSQTRKFSTFYLILYQSDTIQEVRKYLTDKRICLHCGKIMPAIGSHRTNGADHDDWETRMLHKACFKLLLSHI